MWRKCVLGILLGALIVFGAHAQPSSPGYASYEKANVLFGARKLPEALTAADEALRLDPNLIPALTLKAKIAMAGSQFDVASQCLERALQISPRAPYVQFLYGLAAYLGNDLKTALPRLQKARELNPKDSRVALYLGLTTESLGQPQEALSLYRDAVRLAKDAGGLQADTLLPGIRLLLLLGHLDECERWIHQAETVEPKSRDVHFEFARLLLKKGDAAESAAQGERALASSEGTVTDAAIHYLLIRAYNKAGMPEKANYHAQVMRAQETAAPRN